MVILYHIRDGWVIHRAWGVLGAGGSDSRHIIKQKKSGPIGKSKRTPASDRSFGYVMKLGNVEIPVPRRQVLNPQRPGRFPISKLDVLGPTIIPWFDLAVDVDVEFYLFIVFKVNLAFLMAHHRNMIAHRPHVYLACAIVYPVSRSHAVLAGLGHGFTLIVVSGFSVMVKEDYGGFGEPLLDAGIPTVGGGIVDDGVGSHGARKRIDQDQADGFGLHIFFDFGISGCHAKAGV